MVTRKITRAEFMKNYMNVDESQINTPIVEPVRANSKQIFQPVILKYDEILGETEKAIYLLFPNGEEEWFSHKLTYVNPAKKTVTIPKNFARERNLMRYATK